MPFPSQVQIFPAPAVAGDFASTNPRASVLAGNGTIVAGPNGLFAGRFAWLDSTGQVAGNSGVGPVAGFVHREQRGLITVFLGEATMLVPSGMAVSLHTEGDFWVTNSGTNVATLGMKAYANYSTGLVTFGPTGAPPSSGASSASSVAAGAASVTASIANVGGNYVGPGTGIMTVTAVGSGTLVPGAAISGTGIQGGQTIVAQLSGTPGGIGTYSVSIVQTVASTTVTASYGTLTIGGVVSGLFAVGDIISGTGVVAGTFIAGLGTGAGGAGTYIVNNNTVVGLTAIGATAAVETKWSVGNGNNGQPGDVVRITSWPQG